LFHTKVVKQRIKRWHDKVIKSKVFKEGDWALLYDSIFKYLKGKMKKRWMGSYQIDTCYENVSVKIETIDNDKVPLLVNGYTLKIYKKSLTRENYTTILQSQQLNVVERINSIKPRPIR
jgi:hypothetical protein